MSEPRHTSPLTDEHNPFTVYHGVITIIGCRMEQTGHRQHQPNRKSATVTVTGSETRPNLRPVVHLTVGPGEPPIPMSPIPMSWRPPSAPPLSPGERVLLVAERAVGGLAPTLRTALLMLVCALAVVAIVAAFVGLLAAVLSTVVLGVIALLRR